MGSTEEHTKLVNDILITLSSYPKTRAFKMNVGSGLSWAGNPITWGTVGVLDILVLCKDKYYFLDGKTGNATLSKDQLKFQRMVRMLGGIAEAVHSVEEAIKIVSPE